MGITAVVESLEVLIVALGQHYQVDDFLRTLVPVLINTVLFGKKGIFGL